MRLTYTKTSILDLPATRVFELLQQPSTLVMVAQPLITYKNESEWPNQWRVEETVTLLPVYNGRTQASHHVKFVRIDSSEKMLETHEWSRRISTWNHTMEAIDFGPPLRPDQCLYTDIITLEGPWYQVLFYRWLVVNRFYTHRHRRWKQLIARGIFR